MASKLIEFQVVGGGGDQPKTFNALKIGIIEPVDDNTTNIYSEGSSYTVEGGYDAIVAAVDTALGI